MMFWQKYVSLSLNNSKGKSLSFPTGIIVVGLLYFMENDYLP